MTQNELYLWDTNILRHFSQKKSRIHEYVERVGWSHSYVLSVVVAEILWGRIDLALKATPEQMQNARQQMMDTLRYLDDFKIVVLDDECAEAMGTLQKKYLLNDATMM